MRITNVSINLCSKIALIPVISSVQSIRCNNILKHKIHVHCTSFMVYGLPSTVNISSATQDTQIPMPSWCGA